MATDGERVNVKVLDLQPGDIVNNPRGIRVTVESVTEVKPEPADAYKYDDFRGSGNPYAFVATEGGGGFYVKDLGTVYEMWADEDGRRPLW